MDNFKFNKAVAFITFIRLDTVKVVFEEIRKIQPPRLYLISDGPRENNAEDLPRILEVRKYIEEHIDWPCEVHKNYSEVNLGCRERPITGITWALETEEDLVILEDDCCPSKSFFRFMQEMLDYYKDEEKIMSIGGTNPLDEWTKVGDYIFTQRPRIWGWATWKRAWSKYDANITTWPEVKKSRLLRDRFPSNTSYEKHIAYYDEVYNKELLTCWDYQWDYAILCCNGLTIVPAYNLVMNVGFGEGGTHTINKTGEPQGIRHELDFPVNIRPVIEQDMEFDNMWLKEPLWSTIKWQLKKISPNWLKVAHKRYWGKTRLGIDE